MFRPRIGQQLLFTMALGLVLSPAMSWAGTIPAAFNSANSIASVSVVNSISIANNGSGTFWSQLDLSNNDLIIESPDEATALATLANVTAMVSAGRNGGAWNGMGIVSSDAALDFAHDADTPTPTPAITALGVILNDDGTGASGAGDGSGNPLHSSFDGVEVDQYAVLVKYTYFGDTHLNGSVGPADVARVKSAALHGLGGWNNGQSSYNGLPVAAADISRLKKGAAGQSLYPFTSDPFASVDSADPSISLGEGSVAVPEPGSLVLAILGLAGAAVVGFGRRRVNRRIA